MRERVNTSAAGLPQNSPVKQKAHSTASQPANTFKCDCLRTSRIVDKESNTHKRRVKPMKLLQISSLLTLQYIEKIVTQGRTMKSMKSHWLLGRFSSPLSQSGDIGNPRAASLSPCLPTGHVKQQKASLVANTRLHRMGQPRRS